MVHLYFVNDIFIKDTTEQKPAPNPVARGLGLDVAGILAVTWVGKKKNQTKKPHQLKPVCVNYHCFYIVRSTLMLSVLKGTYRGSSSMTCSCCLLKSYIIF